MAQSPRYFIVFYEFDCNDKRNVGHAEVSTDGGYLNKEIVQQQLSKAVAGSEGVKSVNLIFTNIIELSSTDFYQWKTPVKEIYTAEKRAKAFNDLVDATRNIIAKAQELKVTVSENQNTLKINDNTYRFVPMTDIDVEPCKRCDLYAYCLSMVNETGHVKSKNIIPCLSCERTDGKNGVFRLKV